MAHAAVGVPSIPENASKPPRELVLPLVDALGRASKSTPDVLALLHLLCKTEDVGHSLERKRQTSSLLSEFIRTLFQQLAAHGSFVLGLGALNAARKAASPKLFERCWPALGATLDSSMDGDALGHISGPDLARVLATPAAQQHSVPLVRFVSFSSCSNGF